MGHAFVKDSSNTVREINTSEPPSLEPEVRRRTPQLVCDSPSGGKWMNVQPSKSSGGEPYASTPNAHVAPAALSVQSLNIAGSAQLR